MQRIIEQLMYNQLYAPDYPVEDCTNLDRQATFIIDQLNEAIALAQKQENVADWLRLGAQSVTKAFEKFRENNNEEAGREIEAAIQYLRNASSRKSFKRNFIAHPDGIEKAPD